MRDDAALRRGRMRQIDRHHAGAGGGQLPRHHPPEEAAAADHYAISAHHPARDSTTTPAQISPRPRIFIAVMPSPRKRHATSEANT